MRALNRARLRRLGWLAGAILSASASAQGVPDVLYSGTWSAVVQPTDGAPQVSKLVIMSFGGTWYRARTKALGCKAEKFPLTVQETNAESLEFTVWGSAVSPKCPDLTVAVKPVNKDLMEGTIQGVGIVKLTRKSTPSRGR